MNYRSLLILGCLFILNHSLAQWIDGPDEVTVGQYYMYTLYDDVIYWDYSWQVNGGTVEGHFQNGTAYSAYIYFTTPGWGSVYFLNDWGGIVAIKSVYIQDACSTPQNPNTTLTPSTNNCNSGTITYSGGPPSGVTWYWQTSPSGTSTANWSSPHTVTSSGTYYLKAKSNSGNCWSSGYVSTSITINASPAAPGVPTVSTNTCGPKTLTKNGTPPSGVSWFWQGTNASGTDYTSSTATASNYTAATHGSNINYYIRARNNTTGCWSNSTGVLVSVNNPPAPNPNSFAFCEWETMTMTTTGYLSSMRWYNSSNVLVHTGSSYTPANLNWGNYSYTVKSYVSSCESTSGANISLTVTENCDDFINWTEAKSYGINPDGSPKEVGAVRVYADGFGKGIQAQAKSYANNQVFATENIYDSDGTFALTTLPAPINKSTFHYRYRFVTNNNGQKYKASDFDLPTVNNSPGEINNPRIVGNNGLGTLGWYYSSANNIEPFTATTAYPYSRSWIEQGPDPKVVRSAGPGEQYKMGSGHELKTEKQKWTTGEINHYYTIRGHFVTGSTINTSVLGYKFTITDPDGKKAVEFIDGDGKTLATAILISPGNYDYWSYVFYNDLGQLVATVTPRGVNTSSYSYPDFTTTYKYDHLGRLIETTSPDEGTTQYVYSFDGKLRFSQNQEQRNATSKRFSYTNYDYLGRLIEAGEYTALGTNPYVFEIVSASAPVPFSVLTIADNVGHTGITKKSDPYNRCSDYSYIEYDRQATDLPSGDALHAAQTNTLGQVTRTENANAKTWYSYDEFGQLLWAKQHIASMGVYKTVDYTYDFLGNVTEVAYQKGNATEAFHHHYTYNDDQQLTQVRTSKDGNPTGANTLLHATYKYYLHGPLKRAEIASSECKQGIDYIYTINGALKSINHSDPAKDPGLDGISGPNVSFVKDFFGETLHYHDNDYTGANLDLGAVTLNGSTYPNQYGGNLRAMSYNNSTDLSVGAGAKEKRLYAYQYDAINQLSNAQWGNVTGNYPSYSTAFGEAQREQIPGYDKNGNITSLVRKGKQAQTTANYTYAYPVNNNRLTSVNHNGTQLVGYTYNAIGQMTMQDEGLEKKFYVKYNAYGLVSEVRDHSNTLLQTYSYDDRGDLIRKISYIEGVVAKTTYYISDVSGNTLAVYDQPNGGSLQLAEVPVYGAGRIALYKPPVNTYFYEFTDHLGNVRAVCGLPVTEIHTATMESEFSEEPPFKNVANTRVVFNMANTTPNGNEVSKLNSNKPAGPTIALPVSPGDKIDLDVWAYYESGSNYNSLIDQTLMINAIATAFGGVSGGNTEQNKIWNNVQTGFTGTIGSTSSGSVPAAFLTWVVYDQNFVRLWWGSKPVTTAGNMANEHLVAQQFTIEQPGHIYVCLYNRSNSLNATYFDDLTVKITHSPIVAGADYYPFGLVMDGNEIRDEKYRYGYQGQYSEENETTGWNEFELRMYDARFGRWLSPDPYGQFASPYLAMGNAPHMYIDPDGGVCCTWAELLALSEQYAVTATRITSTATTVATVAYAVSAVSTASRVILQDGIKIWYAEPLPIYLDNINVTSTRPKNVSFSFDADPSELMNIAPDPNNPLALDFQRRIAESMTRAGDAVIEVGLLAFGPEIAGAKMAGSLGVSLFRAMKFSRVAKATQFMKYQGNFVLNSSWKKWPNYMSKQGWTYEEIQQTLIKGNWEQWVKNQNWLNPGNSMSIVRNPHTGKSLIIDNVTKEIIQLGKAVHKF